jgi:hypothetical protein
METCAKRKQAVPLADAHFNGFNNGALNEIAKVL